MPFAWFDPNQSFEVIQNNGQGFRLILDPGAPGTFTGLAHMTHQVGQVAGRVQGLEIVFVIRWGDGKVGSYTGFLFPDGRIRGETNEIEAAAMLELDALAQSLLGLKRITDIQVGWWSADGYQWMQP